MNEVKSELLAQERTVVVPGDLIARGLDWLPGQGCYRVGSELRSKVLGLVRTKDRMVSVVPLAGAYIPRPGDGVIATVSDMSTTFWICELNSPYDALLNISEAVPEFVDTTKTDISVYYDIGDVIYAKILAVSRTKNVSMTMNDYRAKKLIGGRLVRITPHKVPRVIGKEGSMVELIKNKTGCQITVGQNGVIWLRGQHEGVAAKAILLIEQEAHIEGLTDRVTRFLDKEMEGKTVPELPSEPKEGYEGQPRREI